MHIKSIVLFLAILTGCSLARDRDDWQQPDRIMDSLDVRPGMVIGEIGAGHGYLTIRLAERVGPLGHIYANDIDEDALEDITEKANDHNLKNITIVYGKEDHPMLPDSALDMVVMLIAFHDFSQPVAMLQNIKPSLKNEAPVVIIERDPEKWGSGRDHFWSIERITRLIKQAKYKLIHIYTFLPRDNIFICLPEK